MNPFVKQLLTVGALTLAGLAILILLLQRGGPRSTAQAQLSQAQSAVPGIQTDARRTDEYDYDPPAPGSYDLPVWQEASDGTVVAPDGRPVQLHDLLDDRVAILSFIYTRCGDPRACLRASGVLSELQQLSRRDESVSQRLQLITLSFDPGYDTPEVMERYGHVFDRGEGGANWMFLTTRSDDDLRPLLQAYGQRVDKRTRPSALGPYQHTLRVYLIDSHKRIRNIYSYGLLDPRLVMADVRTLLLEDSRVAVD